MLTQFLFFSASCSVMGRPSPEALSQMSEDALSLILCAAACLPRGVHTPPIMSSNACASFCFHYFLVGDTQHQPQDRTEPEARERNGSLLLPHKWELCTAAAIQSSSGLKFWLVVTVHHSKSPASQRDVHFKMEQRNHYYMCETVPSGFLLEIAIVEQFPEKFEFMRLAHRDALSFLSFNISPM